MDQRWWRDYLAAVRESRLAKMALVIWGVSAAWDLLGSQWVPISWGEKWPTAYEVVAKTTGYFPWWVWLIVGTLIVVAASLAYAGEQKRRADVGGHHDCAISAYQRALELNPNDADVLNDFGQCLSFAGRATEGVEVVHKAMRLNPH